MTTTREEAPAWCTDPYTDAVRNERGPLFLRRADGWLLPLEVERWCAVADTADLSALRRCEGAVLDIGCGPGRIVAALAAAGHRVLGIDVSEAAVARTVRLGGAALQRSVFAPCPARAVGGRRSFSTATSASAATRGPCCPGSPNSPPPVDC